MLMEETPPAAAAAPGVGAQTLALAVAAAAACSVEDKATATATAKRARKRSRYLDDDYEIPTILNGLHADAALHDCIVTPPPPPAPRKGVAANEGPALLHRLNDANVAAPDLLAALHRRAASPYGHPPGPEGVDAGALLAFFDLYRAASISVAKDATHCSGKDTAARPNPCRAMAVSNGSALVTTDQHRSNDAPRPNPCRAMTVSNGSAGKEQQAGAVTMAGHAAYAQAHHHIGVGVGVGVGPAAALGGGAGEAGPSKRRRKKKVALAPGAAGCSAQPPTHGAGAAPALDKANNKAVAFALGAPASAAGDGCSAQPPAAATHTGGGITGSTPKKAAKSKKAVNGQHFSKPVALILQFAPGTAADQLPSKEQLHTTLRGFGPLIEPSTEITRKQARVVFQSSAAAEAAYSCVHTLGTFAGARLQYLRPPPPPPKIPLTDVRKNLEKMIASLTGPSLLGKEESAWSLAGEMQHLLVKVDRALNAGAGPSTSVAAHHH